MEYIEAKTMMQKSYYSSQWFGIDYNMNLYKGCPHGCIYCDSRSDCYKIEHFDKVRVKKDAIMLLEKECKKKRKKGVLGIGSMSDTYNPFEKKYKITRKALEIAEKYGFGISMDTKSDLIVRDIDILERMNKTLPVILKVTITTADDRLSKKIEPHVCVSSKRFEAIKKLSQAGLFVGVLLTPILPFITDSEENIRKIVRLAYEHGAKFVYMMNGVTLRANQRAYYYAQLDKLFPGLKKQYINTYQNQYMCNTLNRNLYQIFIQECKKYGLKYKMSDIINAYKKEGEKDTQISLFS